MKWFAVFVLLVLGAGVAGFKKSAAFRERVRLWNVSNAEKPALETYLKGKALLRSAWPGDPGAEYAAWGDDSTVLAKHVTGDIWKAQGEVTYSLAGTTVRHPWVILFHRDPLDGRDVHDALAAHVGPEAEETVAIVERKLLEVDTPAATPTSGAPPARQPGKPGEWLFKNYRNPLDNKPRR